MEGVGGAPLDPAAPPSLSTHPFRTRPRAPPPRPLGLRRGGPALTRLPGPSCAATTSSPTLTATVSANDGVLGSGVAGLFCAFAPGVPPAATASVGAPNATLAVPGAGVRGRGFIAAVGGGQVAVAKGAAAAAAAAGAPTFVPCDAGLALDLPSPGAYAFQAFALDAANNSSPLAACTLVRSGVGGGGVSGRTVAAIAGGVGGAAALVGLGLLGVLLL